LRGGDGLKQEIKRADSVIGIVTKKRKAAADPAEVGARAEVKF